MVVLLCTLLYGTAAVQHKELTNEDPMELEAQRKDEERQEEEEVTEEPKRFTTQEMARGFSLFEEAMLVFVAHRVPNKMNPNRTTPRHIVIKMAKVKEDFKGSKRKTKS